MLGIGNVIGQESSPEECMLTLDIDAAPPMYSQEELEEDSDSVTTRIRNSRPWHWCNTSLFHLKYNNLDAKIQVTTLMAVPPSQFPASSACINWHWTNCPQWSMPHVQKVFQNARLEDHSSHGIFDSEQFSCLGIVAFIIVATTIVMVMVRQELFVSHNDHSPMIGQHRHHLQEQTRILLLLLASVPVTASHQGSRSNSGHQLWWTEKK